MNKFIIFVLLIIFVVLFISKDSNETEQRNRLFNLENNDNNTQMLNDNFLDLELNKQDSKFKIFTATPTVNDLRNGNIVLFYNGGCYRLYTKMNNVLLKIDCTVVQ